MVTDDCRFVKIFIIDILSNVFFFHYLHDFVSKRDTFVKLNWCFVQKEISIAFNLSYSESKSGFPFYVKCSIDLTQWLIFLKYVHRPVAQLLKDIAVGAEGLWFDSRAGQIGRSVANGSSPLRCFFGAVLRGAEP